MHAGGVSASSEDLHTHLDVPREAKNRSCSWGQSACDDPLNQGAHQCHRPTLVCESVVWCTRRCRDHSGP